MDALQTRASLRLSQCRGQEAAVDVWKVYQSIEEGCEALANLVGLGRKDTNDDDDDNDDGDDTKTSNDNNMNGDSDQKQSSSSDKALELVNVEAANKLPGFEFRCQTGKLLLECADALANTDDNNPVGVNDDGMNQHQPGEDECIQAAIRVFGSLMAENDEVVEVWYLLGCAFAAADQNDLAAQYLSQAQEMLLKVREGMRAELEETQDEELRCELNDLENHLGNIESKMASLDGFEMDDDDDEDDGDEKNKKNQHGNEEMETDD